MTGPMLPGSTLGVLGGGQLGRMFALAAHRMGYRVAVFSDKPGGPGSLVVDDFRHAPYTDLDAVARFAQQVDVVTFEFENVPAATTEAAAEHAPVRPAGSLLHTTQNRIREKKALTSLGLPVAEYAEIVEDGDLETAARQIPGAGLLKTAAFGYDGHGQRRLASAAELGGAWQELKKQPAVFESLVPFELEISVVGARNPAGETALYEPFENRHQNQILDLTLWPARISRATRDRALEVARAVLEGFDVVGTICIEMFVLPDGEILVNEIAPRPHNSGHLTIDAHTASQFEQQVRAITGLPLGSVEPIAPAAGMANLLGWGDHQPDWATAVATPGLHLHLYGKDEATPGRKMGHLTLVGEERDAVERQLVAARARLMPAP